MRHSLFPKKCSVFFSPPPPFSLPTCWRRYWTVPLPLTAFARESFGDGSSSPPWEAHRRRCPTTRPASAHFSPPPLPPTALNERSADGYPPYAAHSWDDAFPLLIGAALIHGTCPLSFCNTFPSSLLSPPSSPPLSRPGGMTNGMGLPSFFFNRGWKCFSGK